MISAQKAQKLLEKMEHLENMISNAPSGITTNYMITNENWSAGFPISESTNSIARGKFTMYIDRWGTSTRSVGA